MALKDIINKIISDAEAKAKQIREKSKQEIKELKSDLAAANDKKVAELNTDTDQKLQSMEKQTQIQLKMIKNSKILDQKRALIENIFQLVLKSLQDLKSSEYASLLDSMLTRIPAENIKNATVYAAAGRLSETKKAFAKISEAPKDIKEISGLTGGFKIISEKVEIDNTFETIIFKEKKQDLEILIVNSMFKKTN